MLAQALECGCGGDEPAVGEALDLDPCQWLQRKGESSLDRAVVAVLPDLVQRVPDVTATVLEETVAILVAAIRDPGKRP